MKKWLLMLCSLILLTAGCARAESAAGVLSWDELSRWVEACRQRAAEETPLNDPLEPEALTEDGYALIYPFATFYTDTPGMTENTVIHEIVVTAEDEQGPRGTLIDTRSEDVLNAFYNENPSLDGSDADAVLYWTEQPGEMDWAWVARDGQRIQTIEYTVHANLGSGWTNAGITYTLQADLIAAVRAWGLDQLTDADSIRAELDQIREMAQKSGYQQVRSSLDGLTLTPFSEDDLVFSGIDYLDISPEEASLLLGTPEDDTWMEDGEAGWLQTIRFENCAMTFASGQNRQDPHLVMMAIDRDGLEGPRALRVGDTAGSVINRFRNGEGEFNPDSGMELLYGSEGTPPCGTAEYGSDASIQLRYAVRTGDGKTVWLLVRCEAMEVCEITLYTE